MLGRGLDRAGETEHLVARRTVEEGDTSASSIVPSVTVPVLSSTIVPIRRVRSRTSGPLDEDAELRPRPVPDHERRRRRETERARARDDQHRDRGRERVAAEAPATSQPASVASAIAITIGTKTAETRSASRWTGALPDCAASTSRAICASAVSAPTFVARTTSRPYVLTVAPGDLGARLDLDRHGLARQHRLVDRRLALDDDAVGRDLLAGPDDEQVADDDLVDRHGDLVAVAKDARLLRAELEQRADRLARAALRARLEVAAEQDERGDDGGDLEVRVRRRDPGPARPSTSPRRRACRWR